MTPTDTNKPWTAEWIVVDDSRAWSDTPRYEAFSVSKRTEKTILVAQPNTTRERRFYPEDVLWSGDESMARHLAERLTSSVGLMKDEIRRSRERHAERARAALQKARGCES